MEALICSELKEWAEVEFANSIVEDAFVTRRTADLLVGLASPR
jgi:hypothetical protein